MTTTLLVYSGITPVVYTCNALAYRPGPMILCRRVSPSGLNGLGVDAKIISLVSIDGAKAGEMTLLPEFWGSRWWDVPKFDCYVVVIKPSFNHPLIIIDHLYIVALLSDIIIASNAERKSTLTTSPLMV